MKNRKRGRPKGSKNKYFHMLDNMGIDKLPPIVLATDTKSRLDECMTKLETAVFEAITKLKASI